eukprot:GDKI01043846.1.p2 GENE.GDKI01043846.1~~GDKI01043846.1.p2  ORF type:complete len:139 (-),score=49.77 GDKI01043846.1:384-800(-)
MTHTHTHTHTQIHTLTLYKTNSVEKNAHAKIQHTHTHTFTACERAGKIDTNKHNAQTLTHRHTHNTPVQTAGTGVFVGRPTGRGLTTNQEKCTQTCNSHSWHACDLKLANELNNTRHLNHHAENHTQTHTLSLSFARQ